MGPEIQQQEAGPGLSMLQVVSIVKAHRKHALIIAGIVIVLCALVTKSLPKTYTATATLMVSDQHDPLDPGQMQQQALGPYMATEMQLMQSPSILLSVIDQLKLTEDKNYTAGYGGKGNIREWVKEILAKDLTVEPGAAGSQLISVTAAAHDPSMAAKIANTVADTYLAQERERVSGPANERAKRYADELVELKDKVRVAQDQVTAFRQRNGLPDLTAQGANNIDTGLLASLEARLQEAQNARRAAEVKAASDASVSTNALAPITIQPLRNQIDLEQAQLAQLQSTLGARHPKVLELESQIAANQKSLDKAVQNLSAGSSADLIAARQLEAKLQAAVTEQRAKVIGVSRLQDEGTKYMLELESAQSVYKRALDGYDQIMFASDSRFSKVNLVSRAVPPQTTSKPQKAKLMILGVLAGIFLGLALPVVYELLINRRVRCKDDFERDFAVPVLMEFDSIPAGAA